jgi:uncharacterized protein (DUF433 family)
VALVELTQEVPLSASGDGTIRVAGTRVSLDSIVHHYELGATAEEIALRFPALRLADIHASLAYFLTHRETVAQYLERQRQSADVLRQEILADPAEQQGLARMRERIQRRTQTRKQQSGH